MSQGDADGHTPNASARRLASMRAVAAYWTSQPPESLPDVALHLRESSAPLCFRCRWQPPVSRENWQYAGHWLDRAHLVDHARGGSGAPDNLIPLCMLCHETMPTFADRDAALAWVAAGGEPVPHPHSWQIYTDLMGELRRVGNGRATKARMYRLKASYLTDLVIPCHERAGVA